MFRIPKNRVSTIFSLSVLMFTGHLSSALGQTLETHPTFDVGDKWTFSFKNVGDRKEPYTYTHQVYKTDADSAWLYVETQEPNARRPQTIWRYDLKRADVKEGFNFNPANPKSPGARFSNRQPEDDWIQLPLIAGKKYKVKTYWPSGEGYSEYDVKVGSMEKVKTQAGEFDAYRISADGWWRRTNGGYSGRTGNNFYFAPSAKRIIKSEYFDRQQDGRPWNENVWELVKWEPQAALASALTNSLAPNGEIALASELNDLGNLDRYAGGTVDLPRGGKGIVYGLRLGCTKEAPSYQRAMEAFKEIGFSLPREIGVLYDAGIGTRRSASCGGDVGVRAIGIQLAPDFVGQHKFKLFSDQVTIQVGS